MTPTKEPILYVDDEVDNLTVFKASFRREYEIFVAKSGTEAISILEQNNIKVILTDQRMPEMSGLELLQLVSEKYPFTKNIILTGFTDVGVVIDAINTGNVYRYLTKPWKKDELKIAIDNALHIFNIEFQNRSLLDEIKLTNSKLEKYNEDLEQEVNIRTQKLLETIAIRDKFLDIIAHDIKQPVISFQGFVHLLASKYDTYDDIKRKKIISILHDSSDGLYNLIEDLLNWTKSRLDKIVFEPCDFNLSDIFMQTIEHLTSNIIDKKILIQSNISKGTIVFGDPEMIKIIIRNLLSNAIKFSHPGESIIINATTNETNVICSIEDNGIGIPPKVREQLFDSSKIFSTRGTKGEKGTGLGLTLCKDFVNKNGGELWLESEEGKGSKFFFSLPKKTIKES